MENMGVLGWERGEGRSERTWGGAGEKRGIERGWGGYW